jgi:hypothetical protein
LNAACQALFATYPYRGFKLKVQLKFNHIQLTWEDSPLCLGVTPFYPCFMIRLLILIMRDMSLLSGIISPIDSE